jgi:putative transposon-encoded protein
MKKILIILALAILLYGINVYMTDFYYKKPKYVLGAENSSSNILRDINFRLKPDGEFEYGSSATGQKKWYMDPPWPVPDKIEVTFTDDADKPYSLSLVTDLPKDYNGKILVVIVQDSGNYALKLETSPLDN